MLKAALLKVAGSPALNRQVTRNRLARRVADRFIAGGTLEDAERVIRALNDRGVTVALDYLGENTESEAQARETAGAYLSVLDRVPTAGLDATLPVALPVLSRVVRRELAFEEASRV